MIELEAVSHEFRLGTERVHALKEIQLTVTAGDFVALCGPSGSGKSTLFHIMGGMLTPTEGRVRLESQALYTLNENQRAAIRNSTLGFVFQFFHLLPYYSAVQNVELPLMIAGELPRRRRSAALEALNRVGLAERAHHRPGELSGGEMQRVSLARAVVHAPRLLLADEPTGNLDRASSDVILDLLCELNRELGLTVVMATHQDSAMRRASRVLTIEKGEIIDEASG